MNRITAYHFTNTKLRDGRPIPAIGEWLIHDGPMKMCVSGLHASREPFDALQYAPGSMLHKVVCTGDIVLGDDKLICRKRKIIASFDAEDLLREFARKCALDVIHLWDAPDVVRQYLETGDKSLRAAAGAAAGAAAWAAAWAAAGDAARAAARDAQRKLFNKMVRDRFKELGKD